MGCANCRSLNHADLFTLGEITQYHTEQRAMSALPAAERFPHFRWDFASPITMKGLGNGCATPSTVIWRLPWLQEAPLVSWVVARLISSAKNDLSSDGPGTKLELILLLVEDGDPVISLGSRSGVNWMRLKCTPAMRQPARRIVFPTPGTSSIKLPMTYNPMTRSNRRPFRRSSSPDYRFIFPA